MFSQIYEEKNDLLFTDERLIQIGKQSSLAGFFGDEEKIKRLSNENSEAIHTSGCSVNYVDWLKLNKTLQDKYFDLTNEKAHEDDSPEDRSHLLRLEKIGDHFAIASYQIKTAFDDELWSKNIPAIVSVTMKYTGNYKSSIPSFIRKSLNASYLPSSIRQKVSGDWHAEAIVFPFCAKDYFEAAKQNETNIPDNSNQPKLNANMSKEEFDAIANSIKENALNNLNRTYEEAVSKSLTQNFESVNSARLKKGLPELPPPEK